MNYCLPKIDGDGNAELLTMQTTASSLAATNSILLHCDTNIISLCCDQQTEHSSFSRQTDLKINSLQILTMMDHQNNTDKTKTDVNIK